MITKLVLLLLSICVLLLFIYKVTHANKKKLFLKNKKIEIMLLYNILFLLIILLLSNLIPTIYELFVIIYFINLICFFVLNKKNYSNIQLILKTIFYISIGVIFYFTITAGQYLLYSDVSTTTALSNSIIEQGTLFPQTWNYANGEIWGIFSNSVIAIIPTKIISNQSLSRMFVSCIRILITIIAIIFVTKRYFEDDSWVLSIPTILLFITGIYGVTLLEAVYIDQIMWIYICIYLSYKILDNYSRNKRYCYFAILYSVIVMVNVMSGIRMIAELVIPICVASIIFILINNDNVYDMFKKVLIILMYNIIPTIVGYGIYKWLCTWHNVNNTINNQIVFSASTDTIFSNIVIVIKNFVNCLGYYGNASLLSLNGIINIISFAMCGIICFVTPYKQLKKIYTEQNNIQYFVYVVIVHNILLMIFAICCDKLTNRYMLTSLMLFMLLSSRFIYNYLVNDKSIITYLLVSLFAICVFVESMFYLEKTYKWYDIVLYKKDFTETLISKGVTKGYASYWHAYNYEIWSDYQIDYAAVIVNENTLIPYMWLVDSMDYVIDDNKQYKSALILNQIENDIYSKNIYSAFGEPSEIYKDQDLYIYVFNYDIITNFSSY